MDFIYLKAGDGGVPQGCAVGPVLCNITGAARSALSQP